MLAPFPFSHLSSPLRPPSAACPHGSTTFPTHPQKPTKAYKSLPFLNSREARAIRILCEYEETKGRLEAHGVESTILFFGSARSCDRDGYEKKLAKMRADREAAAADAEASAKLDAQLARLEKQSW